MFYASPIPGSVSVDYLDYFLAFRKGRKDAKVECFQIKWKNLSNTHLLLKNSCCKEMKICMHMYPKETTGQRIISLHEF